MTVQRFTNGFFGTSGKGLSLLTPPSSGGPPLPAFEDLFAANAPAASAVETMSGANTTDIASRAVSTGETYTVISGSLTLDASNRAFNPTPGTTGFYLLPTVGTADDYRVEGTWFVVSNTNGRFPCMILCSDDAGTTYYEARMNVQLAQMELYKRVPGATLMQAFPITVPAVSSTYTMSVGTNGQTGVNRAIELRYNGVVVARVVDNTFTSGKGGIKILGGDCHRCSSLKVVPQARASVNWSPYNGAGHGGIGLRRPEQWQVIADPTATDGYCLKLTSEDKRSGTNGATVDHYNGGGSLIPQRKTYGTYEIRARTDLDSTASTSAVALTWPVSGVWPDDGENDFYETGVGDGLTRDPLHSFIHYASSPGVNAQSSFNYAGTDATAWHVMRMEWTAATVKLYLDTVLVGTVSDPTKIPDVDHFFALQLDTLVDQALPGPIGFYIDYVRIW